MIFYEAPHKLRGTLDDLAVTFGTDRSVSLCRELTKLHEEIKKTTLGEAVAFYRENDPRGEYVILVEGWNESMEKEDEEETSWQDAAVTLAEGMPLKEAARKVSGRYNVSRREVYQYLLKHNDH